MGGAAQALDVARRFVGQGSHDHQLASSARGQPFEHGEIEEVAHLADVAHPGSGHPRERRGNGPPRLGEVRVLDAVAEEDDRHRHLARELARVVRARREDDVGPRERPSERTLHPRGNARELQRVIVEVVAYQPRPQPGKCLGRVDVRHERHVDRAQVEPRERQQCGTRADRLERPARRRELDRRVVQRLPRVRLEERRGDDGHPVDLARAERVASPARHRLDVDDVPAAGGEAREQELLARPEIAPGHLGERHQRPARPLHVTLLSSPKKRRNHSSRWSQRHTCNPMCLCPAR